MVYSNSYPAFSLFLTLNHCEMKKAIITAILLLGFTTSALAATHHYGFILSCGEVRYQSFDHELSTTELNEWTEFYEKTVCGDSEIKDGDIDKFNPNW